MKGRTEELLFFACLAAGCYLFGGPRSAAVLVLLVAVGGRIVLLAGKALHPGGPAGLSLAARSLLGLGLFPFLWLTSRLLPGGWRVPALALALAAGVVVSFLQRAPAVGSSGPGHSGTIFAFLLVLAATFIPFTRIGAPVGDAFAYRAYFSSDYLKHLAVAGALEDGPVPPQNPYFAGEPLHYYWLPYATPAFAARLTGSLPKAMFAFSFTINFLFLLLLFDACRRISAKRRWLPYLAVPLVLAPSLEGLYLWSGRARFSVTGYFAQGAAVNIDGLTRWLWNLPQVDTLLRSLLYTPQHLLGLSFVLLFLVLVGEDEEKPWLLSLLLALSLASSFFVGGILLLARIIHVLGREGIRFVRKDVRPGELFRGLARDFALPACVLALSLGLRMVAPAGGGVLFKPLGPRDLIILFGMNLGFLTVGGIWGLVASRFRSRAFLAVLLTVSTVLLAAIRVSGFESDVALKAGLIVILVLALLTCRLAEAPRAGKAVLPLALLVLLPGAFTAVLDVRNAADVRNARFTSYVPADEMRMLDWVRRNVPRGAIVQDFPPARDWNFSVVPPFSGRPMAVGDRMHGLIFQVRPEAYEARLEGLRATFSGLPGTKDGLHRLGIDYVLWGPYEREAFGPEPEGLTLVRRSGRTSLYAVGNE